MKIRNVIKAASYVKAPIKTHRVRHPIRTFKRAVVLRGLKSFLPTGRKAAALGAVVALPIAALVTRGLIRR